MPSISLSPWAWAASVSALAVYAVHFQAQPLTGLAASASCLLEARHHATRTPILRPQCSESPQPCVRGVGGWDTLCGEREAEEYWIIQSTPPRLSPHIAEMNCSELDLPEFLIYVIVAQLKPLSFGSGCSIARDGWKNNFRLFLVLRNWEVNNRHSFASQVHGVTSHLSEWTTTGVATCHQ